MALLADRDEESSMYMLEQLIPEVMTRVLEFLDVPSRCRLAGFNTSLQSRVYQECSQAWETIDFSDVEMAVRLRLTDYQLSRLLTRVNAREITKELNLFGCRGIQGSGLAPLTDSRVLAQVNLCYTRAEQNPTPFLWVLRTMVSYRLFRVNFGYLEGHDEQVLVTGFLKSLRKRKLEQAKELGVTCSSCQQLVMEEGRQVVPGIHGYLNMRCDHCHYSFCRRGSCPIGVNDCCTCGSSSCDECDSLWQCYTCKKRHCHFCADFVPCNECEHFSCEECDVVGACDNCNSWVAMLCSDCGKRPEICNEDHLICRRCRDLGNCSECNSIFCIKCTVGASHCYECRKNFCDQPSCRGRAKECGACEKTFCEDCKEFEICGLCRMRYCKSHHRFIECEACNMDHCRSCADHCTLCGTACFEDCTCDENRPAKRAKHS